MAGGLDTELEAWRNRPLEAESYPYLFVDARYEKVRMDRRIVGEGVLIVSALRGDGFREILAVETADTESEAAYHELFRSLKARGLKGVELVTSDDHEGLKAAIERHFQGAGWQRCQAHYASNLTGAWSPAPSARSLGRTCAGYSQPLPGRWPSGSLPSWPIGGARRATRKWPSA